MASAGKIFCLILFVILILVIGVGLVLVLLKECSNGYFAESNGQCYQQFLTFTCVNTNIPDVQGNKVYAIASAGNYGCLSQQGDTTTCLTYDNMTDCNAALNQPLGATGTSPYPNVSTVPVINTNIKLCQPTDYNSNSSFCSYLNTTYAQSS